MFRPNMCICHLTHVYLSCVFVMCICHQTHVYVFCNVYLSPNTCICHLQSSSSFQLQLLQMMNYLLHKGWRIFRASTVYPKRASHVLPFKIHCIPCSKVIDLCWSSCLSSFFEQPGWQVLAWFLHLQRPQPRTQNERQLDKNWVTLVSNEWHVLRDSNEASDNGIFKIIV